jgi:two-component system response regulator YesN
MALKKKKNISDRVVEFVLKSSLDDFQDLTVTKIASTFHVNRCYLSRKFKSDKAFTLCEFLIREKLSRSIVLLRENDQITIQELSAKMGFSNTNYFIQIFRNYFGAPPGRYREYISKGNTSLSPKRALEAAKNRKKGFATRGLTQTRASSIILK